jgi:hypothetical protein
LQKEQREWWQRTNRATVSTAGAVDACELPALPAAESMAHHACFMRSFLSIDTTGMISFTPAFFVRWWHAANQSPTPSTTK